MAKKKKNANYVTAKTLEKKAAIERAVKSKKKRKRALIIGGAVAGVIAVVALVLTLIITSLSGPDLTVTHHATIKIKGYDETIHVELYGNEAPGTVKNFVELAEDGFYDGLTFHRIIEGFMMQGGRNSNYDAETINGEFKANGFENLIKHERGVISMARGKDYNSATTQFFIVHKDSPHLNDNYAAFGKVTSGMRVVDDICENIENNDGNGGVALGRQPIIEYISIHAAH